MQLNLQVGLHAEDRVQASNVYYSLKIITTGRNGETFEKVRFLINLLNHCQCTNYCVNRK